MTLGQVEEEVMTLSEATKILTDLANGINPFPGGRLPDESPYHDPQVIRALFTAVQQLSSAPTRTDNAGALAEWAGQPWGAEEDERLARQFDARTKISAIARAHGRTRGAILARLMRLGKLVARNQAHWSLEDEQAINHWTQAKHERSQAGKPWTAEEDTALLKYLNAGLPPEDIARNLRRGAHAVEVRLCKLGKLSPGVPAARPNP